MLASIIEGEIKMDHVDFLGITNLAEKLKVAFFFFLINVYFDNKITIFFTLF